MRGNLDQSLGGLIQQLLALEFSLRLCLAKNDAGGAYPFVFPQLNALPNEDVPLNALTDYSTLGILICRYNSWARDRGKCEVPIEIIEIRNAIAHGRLCKFDDMATPIEDTPWVLVKYSKPTKGSQTVTVTFRQALTADWMAEKRSMIQLASGMVAGEYSGIDW
jgi:hypothetical protein